MGAALPAKQLVSQLHSWLERSDWDELQLQRIQREADQIHRTDPAYAKMVYGIIATLREAPASMREHFEAAIRLAPERTVLYRNYAASLAWAGFLDAAAEQARHAFELAPDDREIARFAVTHLYDSGRVSEARSASHRLAELGDDELAERWREELDMAEALLTEEGASETDLRQAIDLVLTVMQQQGGIHIGITLLRAMKAEGYSWLDLGVALPKRTPEKACELNDQLADAVADQENELLLFGPLVASFSAMQRT
ncbi:MAG: hypothetical protein ACLFSI_02665 [Halorhodospira sp.]